MRRAYLRLKDAEERLKVATQAIEQARESLREIEVRYEELIVTLNTSAEREIIKQRGTFSYTVSC